MPASNSGKLNVDDESREYIIFLFVLMVTVLTIFLQVQDLSKKEIGTL